MILLLFFILQMISPNHAIDGNFKNISCPFNQCSSCSRELVKCSGFTSFACLNFTALDLTEIEVLDLEPLYQLIIDNTLKIPDRIQITKELILRNVKGFSFRQNPFSESIKNPINLRMYKSKFEFYVEGEHLLDESQCVFANETTTKTHILSQFCTIWLDPNTVYSQNLCPLVFRNVHLNFILSQNLTQLNRWKFQKSQSNDYSRLNSSIKYLALVNSHLSELDSTLLDKSVFFRLQAFHLVGK